MRMTDDDFNLMLFYVSSVLDLRKASSSPDQLNSADSGLPSLDVATVTSPSVKPLSARADLLCERAIPLKSSIKATV
ncbi:hypothetical protein BH23PAT1_BH23PAT1_3580 [soil metagenome]